MSYGTTSLTIANASPTSVTVSWSVASASPPSFSWSLTNSGSGTMSGTTSGSGTTSASGSITVTGLTSGSNYGTGYANTIQLNLSGSAGSATIPPSNNVTLPTPPSLSFYFSQANGTTANPTLNWSSSGTATINSTSVAGNDPSSYTSTAASGSNTFSLGYNTSISPSMTVNYTSNGYTSTVSANTSYTTPTAYTVTWNYATNGGSGSPASSQVVSGSSVTAPSATRSGYTFNGWYTASSGGTLAVSSGGSYTPSATVTLYAQFTAIPTFPPGSLSGTLGSGTSGTAYSASVTTTNMNYSGTWSYSGTLPPGLSLSGTAASNTNTLSGTPTTAGTFSFTVIATNSYGSTSTGYSVTIASPPTPSPVWTDNILGAFTIGTAYSDGVTANYMTGYSGTYSVVSGALPAGISAINSTTGAITGTPTAVSTYSFTIQALNVNGSITQSFTGTVQGGVAVATGSTWYKATVKTYVGTYPTGTWVAKPVYVYNGTSWVLSS